MKKIICSPVFYIITPLIAVLTLLILFDYTSIQSDYTKSIAVDDSSKIETALSNAVECVKSRNFVITKISVKQRKADGKFVISCGGIERGNLLSK